MDGMPSDQEGSVEAPDTMDAGHESSIAVSEASITKITSDCAEPSSHACALDHDALIMNTTNDLTIQSYPLVTESIETRETDFETGQETAVIENGVTIERKTAADSESIQVTPTTDISAGIETSDTVKSADEVRNNQSSEVQSVIKPKEADGEVSTPSTRFDSDKKAIRKRRRRSGSIAAKLDWEAVVDRTKVATEEKKRLVRASTMGPILTTPDDTKLSGSNTIPTRKRWDQVASETTEIKRRQSLALSESRAKEVKTLREKDQNDKPFVQMLQDELKKSIAEARQTGRRASLSRAEQVRQELAAANVKAQIERLEALIERVSNLNERQARALWKACLRSQINPDSFFDDDGHGSDLDDDEENEEDDSDNDTSYDPFSARNIDTGEFVPMSWLNARVTCRTQFEEDLERLLDLTEDDLLALCSSSSVQPSSSDSSSNKSHLKKTLAVVFNPTQQITLALQQNSSAITGKT